MTGNFGVDAFNSFLLNAKERIGPGLPQHIVLGNESADLDSIVSASMYAYFLHRRFSGAGVNIAPLANIPSSDISLRPDVLFLFTEAGVDERNLVFLDSFQSGDFLSGGRLRLTLIDHNDLAPSQFHLKRAVVEILDHHADEKQFPDLERRVIEPVGSCATLVAERILTASPELLDERLALFLLGPILLDTVNLDPSKGRCREKDLSIASRLLAVARFSRTEFFDRLRERRGDLSSIGPPAALRRDFKSWTAGGFRFGASVIPVEVGSWLDGRPGVLSAIRDFASTMRLDLYLIMAYHLKGVFSRELIAYSADGRLLRDAHAAFLKPLLALEPLAGMDLESDSRENFLFSIQGNTDISRKILAPKLKRHLLSAQGLS
jgi:exopolyphosphatase